MLQPLSAAASSCVLPLWLLPRRRRTLAPPLLPPAARLPAWPGKPVKKDLLGGVGM